MDLEACLPAEMRGSATTITTLSDGFSGAGVYRVEREGRAFVLKIAPATESIAEWRRKVHLSRLAVEAKLAPPIVHVDEARRAVVSRCIAGSFSAFYGDPRTRETAIVRLGEMLRRVHELPRDAGAPWKEPRDLLVRAWSEAESSWAPPAFVRTAAERMLAEPPPASDRALVLSHNDVHPSNLVFDGERPLLLDWDAAGVNEPCYDLAVIAMFLRLDANDCLTMLSAHDGEPVTTIPARFAYDRRLVAVVLGVGFLSLAQRAGHALPNPEPTLETAPSLLDFYQRLRAGTLSVASSEGQWWFGLGLVKESFAL